MNVQDLLIQKDACMVILACLILQVENHSKIDNFKNSQKYKTSKYEISKIWR